MVNRLKILQLEKYKLLKEAEEIHRKAQEVKRKYYKLCQERGQKLRQASLVENQIYVDIFNLEPVEIEEREKQHNGSDIVLP